MFNITRIHSQVPIITEESARSKTDRISARRRYENVSHSRGHKIVPVDDRAMVDASDRMSTKGCADNTGIDTHIPRNTFSNCYKVNFRRSTEHDPPREGPLLYLLWLHMSRIIWVSPVFSTSCGCCRTVFCTAVTRTHNAN